MSTAAVIPALDNTFGCLFLASIATIGLWGAGSVQAYYYFDIYSNDGYFLKAHVFVVWALDTAHQALILHSTYTYLVTNYANPVYLEHFTSTLRDSIILTAFICLLVQSLFVVRIWRLSKRNYVLTGVVACLTLAQFASTVVYYAKAYHVKDFAALSTIFVVSCTINVITAVADATIAAVLIYLLHSNRTGFKRTDTIIHKLIAYTIHTGLPTGICAIVSLITGIVLRNTFITILFYLLLSRLYMNSMLAALNTRHNLRAGVIDSSEPGSGNITMSNVRNRPVFNKHKDFTNPRIVTIQVDTDTVLDNHGDKDAGGRTPSETDIEAMYTQKPEAL